MIILSWLSDVMTPTGYGFSWQHRCSGPLWKPKIALLKAAGMSIGVDTCIGIGFRWLQGHANNISIGNHCTIAHHAHLWALNEITIADFCMLSFDITICNGGHDIHSLAPFSAPIHIGRGCWVGACAKIINTRNRELLIGDNAIIGANALVIDDVPPLAVVSGVPAKVIGYRQLPERVWHKGNMWFDPASFNYIDDTSERDTY